MSLPSILSKNFKQLIKIWEATIYYEVRDQMQPALLDVIVKRKEDDMLEHCVYRKSTRTWKMTYMHNQNVIPPRSRKLINTLAQQANMISRLEYHKEELHQRCQTL